MGHIFWGAEGSRVNELQMKLFTWVSTVCFSCSQFYPFQYKFTYNRNKGQKLKQCLIKNCTLKIMFWLPIYNALERLISSWLLMLTSHAADRKCFWNKKEVLVQVQSWCGLMFKGGGVVFFTFYQSERNFRSYNVIWIGSWHTYEENRTLHEPYGTTSQSWPWKQGCKKIPRGVAHKHSKRKNGLSMSVFESCTVANGLMGWSWIWNELVWKTGDKWGLGNRCIVLFFF